MSIPRRWPLTAAFLLGANGPAPAQATARLSVDSSGRQANSSSSQPAISADGRFVAFQSIATNLVANDTNGHTDVFVFDRQTGQLERVSLENSGLQGNNDSFSPAISADGRCVAFTSSASNLVVGDTNQTRDVFVRDRWLGTTERVSVDSYGNEGFIESNAPALSADGRFVAFYSMASNLVPGDTNTTGDIFVHDRQTGVTERASVDSAGVEANAETGTPALSCDGHYVAFGSVASNLVAGDTNGCWDVFVRDLWNHTTERASLDSSGAQAVLASNGPSLSADGRFVGFSSYAANLVAGDTNLEADIFVRDRLAGTTARVSYASTGAQANGTCVACALSADGSRVLFSSLATNLVPGDSNGAMDLFLCDLAAGTIVRASVGTGGTQANQPSWIPALSGDGRFAAFSSYATNLVGGDTNAAVDVFAHDLEAPPPLRFCLGDGSAGTCPCANNGATGRGCENSATSGGALLAALGSASLALDTLVLTSSNEIASVLSVFLQGDAVLAPANFGDGLRCTGGTLRRLYFRNATAGVASAPRPGDPTISVRSAALGDVLGAGALRVYQVYYRDPVLGFCPSPQGNSWNASSGLVVVWSQ
jgi:Tol biopolymer transport system component